MADLNKLVEEIKTLSVMEVSELVKMLEEEFGVSAAAPVAVMGKSLCVYSFSLELILFSFSR